MRIVRFAVRGKAKYGILEDSIILGFRGSPFVHFKYSGGSAIFDGNTYQLSEVSLLAPCIPSKVIGLGLNYRTHAEETNLSLPTTPLIFLKPSTAVIGPGDAIVLPRRSARVDYEGELGVVIGTKAKDVPKGKAKDYVIGYTCVNDVSDRDAQRGDGQWTRAKGFDTFAPIGPWIETEVIPDNLKIETYLNGELRQSAYTSDLIFGVNDLVSFISSIMTLLPGDVITTGTPSGIGRMSPGDTVEITIDEIGTLSNPVVGQK
ncbi:MAG: fumarylacetoacetate hydrolase family protein [Dehalococcoidia bacterium]